MPSALRRRRVKPDDLLDEGASSHVAFLEVDANPQGCVFVSLITAAYLHPEEQIGDRFAVLFIAFLPELLENDYVANIRSRAKDLGFY